MPTKPAQRQTRAHKRYTIRIITGQRTATLTPRALSQSRAWVIAFKHAERLNSADLPCRISVQPMARVFSLNGVAA